MRSLPIYSLLFAVLLPSFSPWGTYLYYQANKQYIIRTLCENRDKPQLHCDGQCFLAKKLKAQQDRQDKETADQVQDTPSFLLFCESSLRFVFNPVFYYLLTILPVLSIDQACSATLDGLFRPPRA